MVLLFNEIYTPFLEKKKLIKPCKRSVLHLLTVLQRNKRDLDTFKFNEKTHSTMKQKKKMSLYAEHLHFLIKGAG